MNKENAAQFLPIVQALSEGKEIEFYTLKSVWEDRNDLAFNEDPTRYRIKPTPAPPRRVPMGPEDFPPGSVIRAVGTKNRWGQPLSVSEEGIVEYNGSDGTNRAYTMLKTWSYLMGGYEILRPGETEWGAMSKLEVAP